MRKEAFKIPQVKAFILKNEMDKHEFESRVMGLFLLQLLKVMQARGSKRQYFSISMVPVLSWLVQNASESQE